MGFVSLNLAPLEISLHRLLSLTILKSPVKVWPWPLSLKGVSAITWFSVWIFKKTINISLRNNVTIKYFRPYRVSKSNKFCRYLVSFSFYILLKTKRWEVDDFNCLLRKFNVANVSRWSIKFLRYFRYICIKNKTKTICINHKTKPIYHACGYRSHT